MDEFKITETDLLINMPLSEEETNLLELVKLQETFDQLYALLGSMFKPVESQLERRIKIKRFQLILSTQIRGIENFISSSLELNNQRHSDKLKAYSNFKNSYLISEEFYKSETIGSITGDYIKLANKITLLFDPNAREVEEVDITDADFLKMGKDEFMKMTPKRKALALYFFLSLIQNQDKKDIPSTSWEFTDSTTAPIFAKFISLISAKEWKEPISKNTSYIKLKEIVFNVDDKNLLNDLIAVKSIFNKYGLNFVYIEQVILSHSKQIIKQ